MPRRTSQAAKKETANDSKIEGAAPRRSGRSVAKPELPPGKDASRSRRSSTAAQTAASVADSKSPKGRSTTGLCRESTSPSDSRTRGGREGLETPATRVKSTRRSTGRVNYKESDGEEEIPTPKYDENFDSGDEFDESESDEKSKPRGRNKPIRAAAKGRGSKEKAEGRTRGRRGRPSKKKTEDEEESKTFDVSDDSMELEVVATKEGNTGKKEKDVSKSGGRRQKIEVIEEKMDSKPKSSRRSARSSLHKEESPKKRPSRCVQAKRYTEDEEDDIEDISDVKNEEKEENEAENNRKRKRESSPEESNKRIKESVIEEKKETDVENEVKEEIKESKIVDEKSTDNKTTEEPMEVDECDSGIVSQDDSKAQEEELSEATVDKKNDVDEQKNETLSLVEEKIEESSESNVEKSEKTSNPDQSLDNKIEHSTSLEPEETKSSKELPKEDISNKKSEIEVIKESTADAPSKPSTSAQQLDATSEETKQLSSETSLEPEKTTHSTEDIKETNYSEVCTNNANASQESKPALEIPNAAVNMATENSAIPTTNSNSAEAKSDHTLNGEENVNEVVKPVSVPQVADVNVENKENSVSKENGAHEDAHLNSSTMIDQYCLLPGRKYKVNSKLKEGILQSVKGQTFGFLSYNLGSDLSVQKEKLLNELHKLNSQIICLQHVPKQFYNSVLEPSLDALGYKSVFCQPEDSLKGMATFYKNSLFCLSGHSDVSLRRLIDKELETSSLDQASKAAIKTHIKRCGCVLFTSFSSVIGTQTITIVNVQIPPSDLSTHALQVSCLAREIIRINGGTNKPLLIGGEFNVLENDASYQLLRDGYLSNDKIDELQQRKDIAVPEKENSSLVDLLWKSFQHPSSNLCSCYNSVLDHELYIPELKATSPDLVWYSSGSLHTIGVLDVGFDKLNDHHISLKADIAFAV